MVIAGPIPAFPALSPQEAAYDSTVRQDIELFRSQSEDFLSGRITADEFRAFRLRRGIYSQRQADVHMIRTKIPGGQCTAPQLRQLAYIADEFGGGKGHLTTRQNVQYHFVPLRRVPDALHKLADARLTTREACYNTVRNVTCCPLSGLTRSEVFNVVDYARRTAFAFLHQSLTDNMPRKFKISFCGCEKDHMLAAIHDVGVNAVKRTVTGPDGQPVEERGFRLVVGGGLGPLPHEAKVLDEFLPVDKLIPRIEAVLRLFNAHGNRKNKNKARLKFVIMERGWDWVRETIEQNYADILQNGGIATPQTVPDGFGGFQVSPAPLGKGNELPVVQSNAPDPAFDRWLESNVEEQQQSGYAIVTIRVDQGNLTGDQMRGVANLAEQAGDGIIRISVSQNFLLAYIPVSQLRRVHAALRLLNLAGAGAEEVGDVVTCPGAYSCNLALTKTMNLGAALVDHLKDADPAVRHLKIRASGCPNSCGQHWIGDIGFYGNARKIGGREVPYYQLLLGGGDDGTGVMRFGLAIQSLPARLAPEAITRILAHYKASRQPGESFRSYVMRFKAEFFKQMTADLAKPAELAPEAYQDWGDTEAFSLQLGRGECAS